MEIQVAHTFRWMYSEKPLNITKRLKTAVEVSDLAGEGRASGNDGNAQLSQGDFPQPLSIVKNT